MSDRPLAARSPIPARLRWLLELDRVWLVSAAIVLALLFAAPDQAVQSIGFTLGNLVKIAPFLLLSVGFAAVAAATGADALIGRAFAGSPLAMVLLAALAGALSPFCSCGVIPLLAALLALGVHALARGGRLDDPLRDGVGNGGCGGAKVRTRKPVVWRFWSDPLRRHAFWRESGQSGLFLARWLTLAFLLESLMLAWIPAELIAGTLGGDGLLPILSATFIGVPAYLNGYAALPLVAGLIGQGMAPGAGLAFLVAGGVTSLPAALAVWALVRPPVFGLYLALALTGSLASGLLFQIWSTS